MNIEKFSFFYNIQMIQVQKFTSDSCLKYSQTYDRAKKVKKKVTFKNLNFSGMLLYSNRI